MEMKNLIDEFSRVMMLEDEEQFEDAMLESKRLICDYLNFAKSIGLANENITIKYEQSNDDDYGRLEFLFTLYDEHFEMPFENKGEDFKLRFIVYKKDEHLSESFERAIIDSDLDYLLKMSDEHSLVRESCGAVFVVGPFRKNTVDISSAEPDLFDAFDEEYN